MNTIYIKIPGDDGSAVAVEKIVGPAYVYKHPGNGMIFRCEEAKAQGILDATGEKIYQLQGKDAIDRASATCVIITTAEYDELLAALGAEEDPEDENPETSEEGTGEEPMSRAELTMAVDQLNADMAALTDAIQKGLSL